MIFFTSSSFPLSPGFGYGRVTRGVWERAVRVGPLSLQFLTSSLHCTTLHYTALPCTAVHCTTLHCTAQYLNTGMTPSIPCTIANVSSTPTHPGQDVLLTILS